METKKPNEITADMEEVRQQFDVWRSAHAVGREYQKHCGRRQ